MLKYVSRQNYTIPGKSTITINFVDPMNYYRVVNSGNVTIYGGTVTMPTRKLYDFKVPAYNAKMYAEENVRKQLYLYNDGTEEATVLVYAFRSQFEPTVLALCDAIFNDTENTVSVEINGFSEPLPTGNNKIGIVGVENFSNLISAVSMNTKQMKKQARTSSGTATETGVAIQTTTTIAISEIAFLSNDGSTDLTVEMVGTDNISQTIVIKAGEVLNNVSCYCSKFYVKGTAEYRCVYNVCERV